MLTTEKLRLVYEMYLRGTENESIAAEKILREQGIDPETFVDEKKIEIAQFPYRTKAERDLVFQVISRALNNSSIEYRASKGRILSKVPAALVKQIEEDWKTILKLWRSEIERFKLAFIIKNDLQPQDHNEDAPKSGLSLEELMEIVHMSHGIKKATLGKLFERW